MVDMKTTTVVARQLVAGFRDHSGPNGTSERIRDRLTLSDGKAAQALSLSSWDDGDYYGGPSRINGPKGQTNFTDLWVFMINTVDAV